MCVISLLSNLHDTSPVELIRCDLRVKKYSMVMIRLIGIQEEGEKKEGNKIVRKEGVK